MTRAHGSASPDAGTAAPASRSSAGSRQVPDAEPSAAVLEVRGLQMHFPLRRSRLPAVRRQPIEAVRAVDGVDFTIMRGESVGSGW